MDPARPLDALNAARNEKVIVELKNGRQYTGTLKAFDIHINTVLFDAEERDAEGNATRKLGKLFIRRRLNKHQKSLFISRIPAAIYIRRRACAPRAAMVRARGCARIVSTRLSSCLADFVEVLERVAVLCVHDECRPGF